MGMLQLKIGSASLVRDVDNSMENVNSHSFHIYLFLQFDPEIKKQNKYKIYWSNFSLLFHPKNKKQNKYRIYWSNFYFLLWRMRRKL
jgi:hypothetical protein